MRPKLSVVICTYNRAESLARTLQSLVAQTNKEFEVVIIDGVSSDETGKVVRSFAKKLSVEIFGLEEKALAKARDLGWRKAKADIVSWIDDDVVVSHTWVENILRLMKDKAIGGVSGPTIIPTTSIGKRDVFSFYNAKGIKKWAGVLWDKIFLEDGRYKVGRIFRSGAWSPGSNFERCLKLPDMVEVDYLEACNMSIRRKLVENVGGYDFAYGGVAEWCELDLAQKVKRAGYKLIFSPSIRVDHNVSVGGIFSKRTGAKSRMENFLRYYFRYIYQPKWGHLWRFSLYILFLDGYWVFKAIKSGNPNWLGGLIGTMTGFRLIKNL